MIVLISVSEYRYKETTKSFFLDSYFPDVSNEIPAHHLFKEFVFFYLTVLTVKFSKITGKLSLPGAAATMPIWAFTLGGK